MSHKNTPDSFWSRVDVGADADCWEWQGALTSSGYGNLTYHGQHVQAHRLSYQLTHGQISLQTGFRLVGKAKRYKRFVLHTCDNRRCCNPTHLFLGSMRTNQLDAYSKGRKTQPRSNHANAKLTPSEVRTIRSQYDCGGVRQIDLAIQYSISQRCVSLIVRRETYKDVA
jgi:uncharacterized Zn-finger protein